MKLKLQNWRIPFLDRHECNLELTPQTPSGCLLTFASGFTFVVNRLKFQD